MIDLLYKLLTGALSIYDLDSVLKYSKQMQEVYKKIYKFQTLKRAGMDFVNNYGSLKEKKKNDPTMMLIKKVGQNNQEINDLRGQAERLNQSLIEKQMIIQDELMKQIEFRRETQKLNGPLSDKLQEAADQTEKVRKEVYTDYFPDVKGFVVQVLFFSTLITAFPILAFCGRVAFFDIFTQEKIKGSSKLIFNVVYVAIITSCAAFGIPILPVVGFAGAVFGFYIAYVSPILVHFACIQNMEKHEEGNPSSSLLSTCGHEKPTVSKPVLIIYYSIVTLIGLLLLVQEIYGTVAKFFN